MGQQDESDVLYAIAHGVKEDLEKHGLFTFTIGSRRVKGRGRRVELIATRELHDQQTLAFKILFENGRISLCDDGFSIEGEGFDRRERDPEFHTYSDYEYANPTTLDDLYEEIERRFVNAGV